MKPNEILRRIRDKKTQKEAAELLEISLPKYNRLENNKCDFDKKVIEKISEVFDFPFDLLPSLSQIVGWIHSAHIPYTPLHASTDLPYKPLLSPNSAHQCGNRKVFIPAAPRPVFMGQIATFTKRLGQSRTTFVV